MTAMHLALLLITTHTVNSEYTLKSALFFFLPLFVCRKVIRFCVIYILLCLVGGGGGGFEGEGNLLSSETALSSP